MAILSKAQISDAQDIKVEEFHVPEWGGEVLISVMSGKTLSEFQALLDNPDKQKDGGLLAQTVALSLVDESGKPLYTKAEAYMLGKKNGAVLFRIFKKITELNKIDDEDIEDVVADFDAPLDEDSTTD
jgi:hypothetical protein